MPTRHTPKQISELRADPAFRAVRVQGFGGSRTSGIGAIIQPITRLLSDFGDSIISVCSTGLTASAKLFQFSQNFFIRAKQPSKEDEHTSQAHIENKPEDESKTKPTADNNEQTILNQDEILKQNTSEKTSENTTEKSKENLAENLNQKPNLSEKHEISVTRERDIYSPESRALENFVAALDTVFLRKQVTAFRRLLFVLIGLFVIQLGVTTMLVFRTPTSIQIADSAPQQATDTLVGLAGEGEPGVRILQDFTVNKGVVDIGFNVEVDKRAISTKQHTNCKTPVPPPDENGCGFTLIPSALGLPLRGVHYQRLTFDIESSGNARLKADIKDYERGALTQDLGTWNSSDPKPYIQLPKRLATSQGIQIKLWTDSGDIVINKIKLEYLTVDHLKQVSLKVGEANKAKLLPESIGIIYEDRNQDRLVTPVLDEPWACKPDFPGVRPVRLDDQGAVILLRDDECYAETKPDFWYTDDNFGALPPGNWILVFPNEGITLPFEVSRTAPKVTLELTEASPF